MWNDDPCLGPTTPLAPLSSLALDLPQHEQLSRPWEWS
jgi:hypothetical protein